jgi:hypothetical protein
MKGSGKYPNFYQICSAVSITNFVLYFTMQIVSVLLPIQKLLQRHRMPCVGICSFSLLLPSIIEPISGGGNAKKALLLTLSKQGFS